MQFNKCTRQYPVKVMVADTHCLSLQADVNLAQGTAGTVAATATHTGAVVIRTGAIIMIGENTLPCRSVVSFGQG